MRGVLAKVLEVRRLTRQPGGDQPVEAESVGADPQIAKTVLADRRDGVAAQAPRVGGVVAILEHRGALPIALAGGIEHDLVEPALVRAHPQNARGIFKYTLQPVPAEAAGVLRVVREVIELDRVVSVRPRR